MWCVLAKEVLPFLTLLEVWKFEMAGSSDLVAQPLGKIFFSLVDIAMT